METPRTPEEIESKTKSFGTSASLVVLSDRAQEKAKNFSYGDRRLESTCLTLPARPQILLLDEPAAGIDPIKALHKWIYSRNILPILT